MNASRCSPDFDVNKESPLVSTWVALPGLPVHYFAKSVLFSLASAVGRPLTIDKATESLSRPSEARVCVEIDVRKERPEGIWIKTRFGDYWQIFKYEEIPSYCARCSRLGHRSDECGLGERGMEKKSKKTARTDHPNDWVAKDADVVMVDEGEVLGANPNLNDGNMEDKVDDQGIGHKAVPDPNIVPEMAGSTNTATDE